jgi:hypothetical protein
MRYCNLPILGSVVAVAAFSLLVAECGGGGSPRVASIASSTAAVSTTTQNGPVAFARCMRSNGVPRYPDPQIVGGRASKPTMRQLGVSESQFSAARSACAQLLPNGGQPRRPTITLADRADYIKGTACMRSHRLPDFPDPTFQNNDVTFNVPSSVDTNSSQFRSAFTTCDKLIPAGLPYGSPSLIPARTQSP